MASSKDPFSILNKDPERGVVKPKYDPSVRVARYRPNTVPKWSEEDAQESSAPVSKPNFSSSISIETPNFTVTDLTGFPSDFSLVTAPSAPTKDSESEEDSLYDSEDYECAPPQPLFKPVFVSKPHRITEQESASLEAEQQATEQALSRLSETRRQETQRLITEALTIEAKELESDGEMLTDEDDMGDPEEYKKWKVREIRRVIREREERSARKKELAEIERRRNLSDWERQEENEKLGTDESAKPVRGQMKFMQKWAHTGAFFQDRDAAGKLDPIFMRDVNAPVEGDFDKSVLPAVLQKRRGDFGQKGQSKWTHLTAEDTTDFNPAFMPDERLALKQQLKQGGFKGMNQFTQKRHES